MAIIYKNQLYFKNILKILHIDCKNPLKDIPYPQTLENFPKKRSIKILFYSNFSNKNSLKGQLKT